MAVPLRRIVDYLGDEHRILEPYALEYNGETWISHPAELLFDRLLVEELSRVNLSYIGGGAGSGKTTEAIKLAMAMEDGSPRSPRNITFCAASGQAASRIRAGIAERVSEGEKEGVIHKHEKERMEAIARKISTVHSACQVPLRDLPEWILKGTKNRQNQNAILIMDECSMVDLRTFALAAARVPLGGTMIIVGDPGQLPPVGYGSPLNYILQTMTSEKCPENWKFKWLDENHRAGDAPALAEYQNEIRDGRMVLPESYNAGGLEVVSVTNEDAAYAEAEKHMEGDELFLAPRFRDASALGIRYARKRRAQMSLFDAVESDRFEAGDSVIITSNCVTTARSAAGDSFTKVFNGQPATIVRWDVEESGYWVIIDELGEDIEVLVREDPGSTWDELERQYAALNDVPEHIVNADPMAYPELRAAAEKRTKEQVQAELLRHARNGRLAVIRGAVLHAGALTIHKSQGSEADSVTLVLTETSGWMSRELYLVAASRAKKHLRVIWVKGECDVRDLLRETEPQLHRITADWRFIPAA
jgi:hypothetical protein